MSKTVIFNEEARQRVYAGIKLVADSARPTMGAAGRNAMCDKRYDYVISNDGKYISDQHGPIDRCTALGVMVGQKAASKTNKEAGDGTTTTLVLTDEFSASGMEALKLRPNAMLLKREIIEDSKIIEEKLKAMAIPAESLDVLKQVAAISMENKEIADIVAEAVFSLGKGGEITTADSESGKMEVEVVKGMRFDRPYLTRYMTNNPSQTMARYKNTHILITNKNFVNTQEIEMLLENIKSQGVSELVIICGSMSAPIIADLVDYKMKGLFLTVAVRAPGTGERSNELLRDIAAATGGFFYDEALGIPLSRLTIDSLGRAKEVTVTAEHTTILEGAGSEESVTLRVEQIEDQFKTATSEFEKLKLRERISKLTNGIGVIKVGNQGDTEMNYLRHKVDDTIGAVQSAWAEGVIPGGGVALLHIAATTPLKILADSIREPFFQILINAGISREEAQETAKKIENDFKKGVDVYTGEIIEDMVSVGIIDPVKVTRLAVLNAAIEAANFITTDVVIIDNFDER